MGLSFGKDLTLQRYTNGMWTYVVQKVSLKNGMESKPDKGNIK
jgi:hypothetical protein